jgi:putative ABC transport system ATP-binding protein
VSDLNCLYEPSTVEAEVVFVHGLNGDAYSTWGHEQPESWVKWFQEDCSCARLWSFGYDASPTLWTGNTMPIVDRARNLLAQFDAVSFGQNPIICVAHSLGGLMVKQAMQTAQASGAEYGEILYAIRGVSFLGTPHFGSEIVGWKNYFAAFRPSVTVAELSPHAPALRQLGHWYKNQAPSLGVQTRAFYETRRTSVGLGSVLVVDADSADPGVAGCTPIPADADHFQICKPEKRTDLVYANTRKLVQSVIDQFEPLFEYVIHASGNVSEMDAARVRDLLEELRRLSEDWTLQITQVASGSIRINLAGTQSGYTTLRRLVGTGELEEIGGLSIRSIEPRTRQIATLEIRRPARAETPSTESGASSAQALVQMRGVRKVFLTEDVETHALAGVDLDIAPGEFVSIAGPSGSGKTTLLSILGLLDTASDGRYMLNSNDVSDLTASERARVRNREIGFIFQSFNLIGDLNVHENVGLPLNYRGMSASERDEKVNAALDRVGMTHRGRHMPSQLSGGQQQRVAVARAVVGDPSILLADEPTGNLDSGNASAVMDLMAELHRGGATICLVTHDPRWAEHAERTIHLFDGMVVDVDSALAPVEV